MKVATTDRIPGYRILEVLGVARGLVVRTPTIQQGLTGSLETFFGGNIQTFDAVCEEARKESFERMTRNAQEMGADAILGMRYDATEFASGVTEVLAYGTAVTLKKLNP